MDLLPKDLKNIIIDYKNIFETREKYKKCLDEIKTNKKEIFNFCDRCNIEKDYLIKKDCCKLSEKYYFEGRGYEYAYECCFCKKCINVIKDFDYYYPNNT